MALGPGNPIDALFAGHLEVPWWLEMMAAERSAAQSGVNINEGGSCLGAK